MLFQKYKKVKIFLCIVLCLSIYCIIQIIMPNRMYSYEGNISLSESDGTGTYVLYENISLSPNVYEIRLKYRSDQDLKSLCFLQDGTVFQGGLLSIGEPLYTNKATTDFHVWLLESTEHFQVMINHGGENIEIGDLTIVETNLLWTMFLTILVFIVLMLFLLLCYMELNHRGMISKEQKSVFFCVMLIVLIASIPYLQPGLANAADIGYHLQRIEGIKTSIYAGQFPVRIEPHWLYEHGYADAVFYCPFFLYLPGILRVLGFPMGGCYAIYCCFINLMTAGISYYCFSRIFKNRVIGVVCCGLYTLSVFRIYRMFLIGVVGEASALTFMPLVLYGFYRLFAEDIKENAYKTVWIPLTIGYAGLIQTHVLSCEITAMLSILVCIVCCKRVFRKETLLELIKAVSATVGLTIWYLVPFIDYYFREDLHIRHVSARTIQDRGLYIAQLFHHFWQAGSNAISGDMGMKDSHPMGIGFVLVVGIVLFLILWFCCAKKHQDVVISFGKLSVLFAVLLMWMSLSIFPWDAIQNINEITAALVSSIQFPNRFLGWGTVFCVAVFGCCMWIFYEGRSQMAYYGMIILALLGITTSSMYLTDDACAKASYAKLYNEEGAGYGYIAGEEYLPEGVQAEKLLYNAPVTGKNVELRKYEKEYQTVDMECVNNGLRSSYIDIPILLYTGYRATDMETDQELEIVRGENGVVRVVLPAGYSGNIHVTFVSPIYWRISEVISAIFICIFIPLCIYSRRRMVVRKGEEAFVWSGLKKRKLW